MAKAMGVVLGFFAAGAVATALLEPWLGGYAEQAALGLVGIGLVVATRALGIRSSRARPAAQVARPLKANL